MCGLMKNEFATIIPNNLPRFTKRDTFGLALGALFGSTILARAQSDEDFDVLQGAFDAAMELRAFAINSEFAAEFDGGDNLVTFLSRDYIARTITLEVANKTSVFGDIESLQGYVFRIPERISGISGLGFDEPYLSSMIAVAAQLQQDELPIAPQPFEVVPAEIPALPPADTSEDTDLKVVVDILLETLGISVREVNLFVSVIESDEDLRQTFEDLLAQITTKDWDEVVKLAEIAFKGLVATEIWSRLRQTAGRKLTWRLGLRAVPVVGWLYCGAAFLVSVKINYSRFSFAQ